MSVVLETRGLGKRFGGLLATNDVTFQLERGARQALIGQLRYVDLQGLGDDYLKNFVQNVNTVSPEQVQQMTAKYIKPELMTIVVVGDKAKIADQLTAFQPSK